MIPRKGRRGKGRKGGPAPPFAGHTLYFIVAYPPAHFYRFGQKKTFFTGWKHGLLRGPRTIRAHQPAAAGVTSRQKSQLPVSSIRPTSKPFCTAQTPGSSVERI